MSIAQREYLVLTLLLLVFLVFLTPSLFVARAKVRDGLRQQDLTHLKHALEKYYNQYENYPLIGDARCISSRQPDLWTFIATLPHDVREHKNHLYRYCVTDANTTGALGYFLEAQLEVDQPDGRFFDEDEQRKYHYRILHEADQILLRVCGGTEMQCQPNL